MTTCLYLIIIYSGVLLSSLTCASKVQRQNTKVRISAIGNTIILKFLEEDKIDTKLEGYIIGYGGSMFSKQVIQLPEDGEPYETEIDAEPKYLIAVQPFKEDKVKKQCAGKEILKKPLHLVIGSVTPTSVLLSWGTFLNAPYTEANLDDCIEDGQFNVRYREKEPNKNWKYHTCPTAGTVIDHLKPETPYEFGVQAETDVDRGAWSPSVTHNTADISIPENPVNMLRTKVFLSTKEPITEAPKTNSPTLSAVQTVTQRRPASLIKQTATPVIPKKPLGTESDGFATSAPSEDLSFLTQAFTHTQMTLPPPTVIQHKPSDFTMSHEQPHTTYFQLITKKTLNTSTKTASSTVTTKLQTIQPEIRIFHTDHSQSKSVTKSHTQPTPRKIKHKVKTTQKQPKRPQPQTTQFQPIPTTSISQTTKSLSTQQSQSIAVKSQSKFQPKLKTTQKTQYITSPQTHSTISQLITIMSRPYTSQSPPSLTQTQPSTTQTQPLTTQTQPSTTPSRPNTTVKQTKNPPKPTQFKEIYLTPSMSQTFMSTMTYHHVPTQPEPIHKHPSFTLPQPLPIKKQASETQSPMNIKNISVIKQPAVTHKQPFTQQSTYKMNPVSLSSHTFRTTVQDKPAFSTNRPLITSTKDHFFTSISTLSSTEANIQEESSQSLLSTTKSSIQPPPSVTFHHQPDFQPTHTPTAAHLSSTTLKNGKTESTSVPQISTGFYRASTHVLRVPKKHYSKDRPTAKPKRIQNSSLSEKKVVSTKPPDSIPAPRQFKDGKRRPNPIRVPDVKNKDQGNSTSFVGPPSEKTSTKTNYDEKHKGILQPKPTKEPKKKINQKFQQETNNEESKTHWDKKTFKQNVPVPIVKPNVSSTTEKTVYPKPLPTSTPLFVLNGSRFDTGDNSSVFSALPISDVDAMGEKRFVGPNVIYRTDKPPDEPCSVTKSLSFFPEEDNMAINVTTPPRTPPANLTVVTVEGCPSFVILDWEKTDNSTTEYDVKSSVKGRNGNEVSVITTNQTHTAVENLKPKSSYEFTVTPKNILGSGPTSETVSFNTESADPRVSEIPTGKNAIWSSFPFKTDFYSECNGNMYVKRTWYRKFVGIQLCNSLRYKIYLSDSLKGKFYNIGDDNGFGEDHCQFVDSFLDGRTGGTLLPNELPTRQGFFRSFRQEPVKFGQIGGNTHINYVGWYECGVPIPGSW